MLFILPYCATLFFIISNNDTHSVLHEHGPAIKQMHLGSTNGRLNIGTNNIVANKIIINGQIIFFILFNCITCFYNMFDQRMCIPHFVIVPTEDFDEIATNDASHCKVGD